MLRDYPYAILFITSAYLDIVRLGFVPVLDGHVRSKALVTTFLTVAYRLRPMFLSTSKVLKLRKKPYVPRVCGVFP